MHLPIIPDMSKGKIVLLGFWVAVVYFKESTTFSSVLFPELKHVSYGVVPSSFISACISITD